MATLRSTREFLQLCAQAGDATAAYVLEHGREFEVKPAPEGVKRGKMGECFANATRGVSDRFEYVEGFAHNGWWPVAHAWLVDREDGLAVDVTWGGDVCSAGYFGVVVPDARLYELLLARRVFGVLPALVAAAEMSHG